MYIWSYFTWSCHWSSLILDLSTLNRMSKLLGAANNELHVQNSALSHESSCFDILYKLLILFLIFDLHQSYLISFLLSLICTSPFYLLYLMLSITYITIPQLLFPHSHFLLNMSEKFCKSYHLFYTLCTHLPPEVTQSFWLLLTHQRIFL